MNSLDTNVLIYAVNRGCVEHPKAKAVYESMLARPREWIVSDQVLFEFYRGLRHPKILERPLSHQAAMDQIIFLRERSGVLHCSYETSFWERIKKSGTQKNPSAIHIFDTVLAVTLLQNGVKCFYTRNMADFRPFSFERLVNPID
ncbi:MAG: TA system VapC family ribonuclease toxin [Verrucomicrobiae bacterium]|nr:TA system VapC family ribonuclease toxin [Verrucomicrobiae bacterium]